MYHMHGFDVFLLVFLFWVPRHTLFLERNGILLFLKMEAWLPKQNVLHAPAMWTSSNIWERILNFKTMNKKKKKGQRQEVVCTLDNIKRVWDLSLQSVVNDTFWNQHGSKKSVKDSDWLVDVRVEIKIVCQQPGYSLTLTRENICIVFSINWSVCGD